VDKSFIIRRVSILLTEFTSIPLLIISLTYFLTGYIMISPFFEKIMCNMLSICYSDALYLHTNRFLRYSLIIFGFIHGLCGFHNLLNKYVGKNVLRETLIISTLILSLLIISLAIISELLSI